MNAQPVTYPLTLKSLILREGYVNTNQFVKSVGLTANGNFYKALKTGVIHMTLYRFLQARYPNDDFSHMLAKRARQLKLVVSHTVSVTSAPAPPTQLNGPFSLEGTFIGLHYRPSEKEVTNSEYYQELLLETELLREEKARAKPLGDTPLEIIRILEENSKLRIHSTLDSFVRETIRKYKEAHVVGSPNHNQTQFIKHLLLRLEQYGLADLK